MPNAYTRSAQTAISVSAILDLRETASRVLRRNYHVRPKMFAIFMQHANITIPWVNRCASVTQGMLEMAAPAVFVSIK